MCGGAACVYVCVVCVCVSVCGCYNLTTARHVSHLQCVDLAVLKATIHCSKCSFTLEQAAQERGVICTYTCMSVFD